MEDEYSERGVISPVNMTFPVRGVPPTVAEVLSQRPAGILPAPKQGRKPPPGPPLGMRRPIATQPQTPRSTGITRRNPILPSYRANAEATERTPKQSQQALGNSRFAPHDSEAFYNKGTGASSSRAPPTLGSSYLARPAVKASTPAAYVELESESDSPAKAKAAASGKASHKPASSYQPRRPASLARSLSRSSSPELTTNAAFAAAAIGGKPSGSSKARSSAGKRSSDDEDGGVEYVGARCSSPLPAEPKSTPPCEVVRRRLNGEMDLLEAKAGKKGKDVGKRKEEGKIDVKGKEKAVQPTASKAKKGTGSTLQVIRIDADDDSESVQDCYDLDSVLAKQKAGKAAPSDKSDKDVLDCISEPDDSDDNTPIRRPASKAKRSRIVITPTPPPSPSSKAKSKSKPSTWSKSEDNPTSTSQPKPKPKKSLITLVNDDPPVPSSSQKPVADSPNTRAKRKKAEKEDQEGVAFFNALSTPAEEERLRKLEEEKASEAALAHLLASKVASPPKKLSKTEQAHKNMMDALVKDLTQEKKSSTQEEKAKKGKRGEVRQMQREKKEEDLVLAMGMIDELEKAEAEKVAGAESQPGSADQFDDDIRMTDRSEGRTASQMTGEWCPFCGKGMPETPAEDAFYVLLNDLMVISKPPRRPHVSKLREIDLLKRIEFCSWHEALTDVIPPGIALGYPEVLDFGAIPRRLEEGWISRALEGLAKFPLRSARFQKYAKFVDENGVARWRMAQLKNHVVLAARAVGYYGALGRTVIAEHLNNLYRWGHFPTLISSPGEISRVDPLTPEEFIENIMIPEAGILLIMADLDEKERATIASTGTDEEKAELRTQAEKVWEQSKEFGMWQFRESAEGLRELKKIKKVMGKLEAEVRQMREEEEKERKRVKEVERAKKRSSEAVSKPAKAPKIPRNNGTIEMTVSSSSSSSAASSSYPRSKLSKTTTSYKARSAQSIPSSPASTHGDAISVTSSSSSHRTSGTSSAVNEGMGEMVIDVSNSPKVLRMVASVSPEKPAGRFSSGRGEGAAGKRKWERTDSRVSTTSTVYSDGGMPWDEVM